MFLSNWKEDSYLFHVPVVHGVIRHFIRLQLNNLFEFIAIAFPLADNDHFIKQEYIPEDIHTHSMSMCCENMSLLALGCFNSHILWVVFFSWVWTHRSCFVRLTIEHTFSSPSIFGLPYSSSFTCCLGHKDTQNVNPLHTMASKFNENPWLIQQHLHFRENRNKYVMIHTMIQVWNYSVPLQLLFHSPNPTFKLFTVSMAHVQYKAKMNPVTFCTSVGNNRRREEVKGEHSDRKRKTY